MKVKSDAPRTSGLSVLKPEDSFRFACHQGLDCFTRCCRDTAIFLTPYDILRMKNALGISSESFLRDYTIRLSNDAGFPVVLLKMGNDAARSCPFVTAEGCRIYPHRPWACRIFPLQPEHAKPAEKAGKQYYFETEPAEVEKIKKDDVELHRFAMKWIEYGLIGQHVLSLKPEVMAAKKRELGIR